ncbi:hypothetical protein CC86DRAFT_373057 [Ophiobolus disseminans]|uniref:Uncharacterized protein n=1 Tax=Ophiobolus disseminans TaxID=1469910 RepID=A0A6A6ZQP9_9PLEO|nr:hypothetical protein CC86DRAFT_373057 [Ophiobolus disseminans]
MASDYQQQCAPHATDGREFATRRRIPRRTSSRTRLTDASNEEPTMQTMAAQLDYIEKVICRQKGLELADTPRRLAVEMMLLGTWVVLVVTIVVLMFKRPAGA